MRSSNKVYLSSIIVLAMVALLLGSCSQPSGLAAYGKEFEQVMHSETGVFRGFSLGDKFDSVKLSEKETPRETDSGYLYYERKLDTAGTYNITYNFTDNQLDEIQSDIYLHSTNRAEEVFGKFKSYFDEHYGQSQNQQGFTVWTVKSQKYGTVRISLSDESSNFTVDKAPGKISLWIYPDKE